MASGRTREMKQAFSEAAGGDGRQSPPNACQEKLKFDLWLSHHLHHNKNHHRDYFLLGQTWICLFLVSEACSFELCAQG